MSAVWSSSVADDTVCVVTQLAFAILISHISWYNERVLETASAHAVDTFIEYAFLLSEGNFGVGVVVGQRVGGYFAVEHYREYRAVEVAFQVTFGVVYLALDGYAR